MQKTLENTLEDLNKLLTDFDKTDKSSLRKHFSDLTFEIAGYLDAEVPFQKDNLSYQSYIQELKQSRNHIYAARNLIQLDSSGIISQVQKMQGDNPNSDDTYLRIKNSLKKSKKHMENALKNPIFPQLYISEEEIKN